MILILLLLLVWWIYGLGLRKIGDGEITSLISIPIVVTIFIIPLSIWAPLQGFEEKECVEEIQLVALQDREQEGVYFVEKDVYGVYTYAYSTKDEYDLEGDTYNEKDLNRVKIYQSPDCTIPVLKVFESKAKFGIFSFGFYTETEYVFFIPEGTVLQED